jgi:uncharacterized protein YaaW (UPF0174 family)
MKLNEFFNVPIDKKEKNDPEHVRVSAEEKQKMADEVFWFIIDHDMLHKEYSLPFVRDMKDQLKSPNFDKDKFSKMWMPMVNKGCHLYYKQNKLKKDPKELFDKELRDGLCKSLGEKFIEEINDNAYHIGSHGK